jgi:hypothetical protein
VDNFNSKVTIIITDVVDFTKLIQKSMRLQVKAVEVIDLRILIMMY